MDIQDDILIELVDGQGKIYVSTNNINDVASKSKRAMEKAMRTIEVVSKNIVETIKEIDLSERPHTAEIKFGIKLTSEANALITTAGVEAQFEVKLVWNRIDS